MSSTSTTKWTRSLLMQRALPLLRDEFRKQSNGGVFPIFTKTQLQQAWKDFPPHCKNDKGAAVLVPICVSDSSPCILFTKRASHLSSHSSEISFPGGHVEEDESVVEAALREAQEEIATEYPWESVEILGTCTPVPSIKGVPVTPVIAVLPFLINEEVQGDPSEVELVFLKSIDTLTKEETAKHLERLGRPAPVYPTNQGDIWGLTAFVLKPILHKLLKPVFAKLQHED